MKKNKIKIVQQIKLLLKIKLIKLYKKKELSKNNHKMILKIMSILPTMNKIMTIKDNLLNFKIKNMNIYHNNRTLLNRQKILNFLKIQ